ncbi:hypothetical protein [Ornithinibacillus xuwenensis]|uniref:Uncharacterized protein n=1 Tax=Ornithinibacillus xuwenensis TaxID=3144668 RepID=A0ABU9XJ57_9BACI
MEEKQLDEILHEMKYDYERLPEFMDKEELIHRTEPRRRLHAAKKFLPSVIAVLGVILFTIISLTYLDWDKKRASEAEQTEDELEESALVESNEIDPELKEYLANAIEDFKKEIGLEDISNFSHVAMIEQTIKDLKQYSDSGVGDEIDQTKEYIDSVLTTPSMAFKELNHTEEDEQLLMLMNVVAMFQSNLQEYLGELLIDNQIKIPEYPEIIAAQENPETFTGSGSDEIRKFLTILKEQGYSLSMDSKTNYISVQVNYDNLKQQIIQAGFSEGYVKYVDYAKRTNTFSYAMGSDSAWEARADYLLELEALLMEYGQDYSRFFKENLIYDAYFFLDIYLMGPDETRPLTEESKQEFKQFLEEHEDSVFWDIINVAVQEWEKSNWMNYSGVVNPDQLEFLFDERFRHVHYQDIVRVDSWPFTIQTVELYDSYKDRIDQALLTDKSPIDILSLYTYAFQKDDVKTYSSLTVTSSELQEINWWSLKNEIQFLVMDYPTDNQATIYLVEYQWEEDSKIAVTVQLKHTNGLWKISSISRE